MLQFNKKELASIYHDLDGLTNYVECMESKLAGGEFSEYFKKLKRHIEQGKQEIIEGCVRDIMGAYVKTEATYEKRTISLSEAKALSSLVEQEARNMGLCVIVAVYNPSARPVLIHCMEDAYIASFDIAMNKAYTSAALKMSTSKLKTLSNPGGELYGIQHTNESKIVIFGGGDVLIHQERIVGAIGVSGGSEEEDSYLSAFGMTKLKEVIF